MENVENEEWHPSLSADDRSIVKGIISYASTVLLDIEGTTTSIRFVKDVLFPYAEHHLADYIKTHWNEDAMKDIVNILIQGQEILKDSEGFIPIPPVPSDESQIMEYADIIISHLKWQQLNDFKTTGLKRLQGYIWKEGYLNKSIEGHLYADVPDILRLWKKMGKKIFIYSSGSIAAQKLLFCSSIMGNLDELIDGNFDTTIGSKIESESYLKIAKSLDEKPQKIVFFTDRTEEVSAAKRSGMHVVRIEREDPIPDVLEEKILRGQEDAVLASFLPLLAED